MDLIVVGVIAEVDEGTEQELVSLAANPQPFPPPVLVEAPDQVQEFQASIAQVTTLFTTYNKVPRHTISNINYYSLPSASV